MSTTWEAMEPRARDAWVAEHVMGCGILAQTGWCNDPKYGAIPIPHFTTDAADDYRVLRKVREWDEPRREAFITALEWIWGLTHWGEANPIAYAPGDYSHAAYLALTGGEGT